MVNRACVLAVLAVLAGPVFATFEIRDPATEIYEAESQDIAATLAGKTCVQFLLDGVDHPDDYWAIVNTAIKASGQEHTALSAEKALKTWCIDHPKHNLLQASAGTGFVGAEP
mgnify:CR=1 FL=1